MEQLQSQREMMLDAREAVDHKQLEEMNLSRSLALDTREKSLRQQEQEAREALSKMLNRWGLGFNNLSNMMLVIPLCLPSNGRIDSNRLSKEVSHSETSYFGSPEFLRLEGVSPHFC